MTWLLGNPVQELSFTAAPAAQAVSGAPIGALVPVDAVVRAALGEVSVTAVEPAGPAGPAGPAEPEPPFPTDPTEPDPAHPTEPSDQRLVDPAAVLGFVPANAVERGLQVAIADDDPDLLMDVLVTATVWLPATYAPDPGATSSFPWRRVDGVISVFTSPERLSLELPPPAPAIEVPFLDLVTAWPLGEAMVVNPGSPIAVAVAADRIDGFLEWAAGLPERYADAVPG
jgi:SseB protein N-terminal domain